MINMQATENTAEALIDAWVRDKERQSEADVDAMVASLGHQTVTFHLERVKHNIESQNKVADLEVAFGIDDPDEQAEFKRRYFARLTVLRAIESLIAMVWAYYDRKVSTHGGYAITYKEGGRLFTRYATDLEELDSVIDSLELLGDE